MINNIFFSTRIKLTIWYMVISYAMLAFFTLAVIAAHNQTFKVVEQAIEEQGKGIVFNVALQQQISSFTVNFIQRLIIFDLIIAVAAGLASYILSGRTLRPIEHMLTQQQQFAADASHELRTPLANITMEIAAYRQDGHRLSSQQAELLDSIEAETQRMTSIVAGLLSLVRASRPTAAPQLLDVDQLIRSVMSAIEPRYRQSAINLEYHQTDKRSPQIIAQPDELRQLLLILLENALLYSHPHTTVTINLDTHANQLRLTVNNHGPVIPARELSKIFSRFYRGSQATASGTGLGLAIAQAIVNRHQGTIAVASNSKNGTTFRVLLPYKSLSETSDSL